MPFAASVGSPEDIFGIAFRCFGAMNRSHKAAPPKPHRSDTPKRTGRRPRIWVESANGNWTMIVFDDIEADCAWIPIADIPILRTELPSDDLAGVVAKDVIE